MLSSVGQEVYSAVIDEHLALHIDKQLRSPGEWLPVLEGHTFKVGDMVIVDLYTTSIRTEMRKRGSLICSAHAFVDNMLDIGF